jgi:hypothetical protein
VQRLRMLLSQSEAKNARVEQLEQQLREAQKISNQHNLAQSDQMKVLLRERDSARMHYEELQNRHTGMQRRLQAIEEQREEGTSAASRLLNESEARATTLMVQKQQLVQELENARNSMANAQAAHDQEAGKLQADLVAAKNEMLKNRTTILQMKGEHEQELARLASRLSRENSELMSRILDLEQQHVSLTKVLGESQQIQRRVQEEARQSSEQMTAQLAQLSAELSQREASISSVVPRNARRRCIAAWASEAKRSAARAWGTHAAMRAVHARWMRRTMKVCFSKLRECKMNQAHAVSKCVAKGSEGMLRMVVCDWVHATRCAIKDRTDARAAERYEERAAERVRDAQKSLAAEHGREIADLQREASAYSDDLKAVVARLEQQVRDLGSGHLGNLKILGRAAHK